LDRGRIGTTEEGARRSLVFSDEDATLRERRAAR